VTIAVRDEEPPDDTVVVVRGGIAASESLRRSAEVSMAVHGFLGVSVFLAIGMTVDELVRRTPELSGDRYKQLRTTTAGALRAAGFRLLATGEWPHYDVALPDLTESSVEAFRHCFGPPFPNPHGGGTIGQ
jgi:hypothetical protein